MKVKPNEHENPRSEEAGQGLLRPSPSPDAVWGFAFTAAAAMAATTAMAAPTMVATAGDGDVFPALFHRRPATAAGAPTGLLPGQPG